MAKLIRLFTKQMFCSKSVLCILIFGFYLLLAEGYGPDLITVSKMFSDPESNGYQSFFSAFSYGYFYYAACIFCVIPAVSFVRSMTEQGMNDRIVTRFGKDSVIVAQWVSAQLSGGCALLFPTVVYFLFCRINNAVYCSDIVLPGAGLWNDVADEYGIWASICLLLFLVFLFGATWSNVGLTISYFTTNQYAAYTMPFVICLTSTICFPAQLQPFEMMIPLRWSQFSLLHVFLYSICISLISVIVLWKRWRSNEK